MKGTKITYKSKGRNPDGDNRINLRRLQKTFSSHDVKEAFDDPKMAFMKVTDHELFGINKLRFESRRFLLLEPNPVTFYFSLAYDVLDQFERVRRTFVVILDNDRECENVEKDVAFSLLFRVAAVGVVFSALSLEAFLNQQLPDHTLIALRGKMMTKGEIERRATFKEKMVDIIPSLAKRNFATKFPKKMAMLESLHLLRNELIHLKQRRGDGITVYDGIFQEILDMNLKTIVLSVKSFINFYQPGLIQNFRKLPSEI